MSNITRKLGKSIKWIENGVHWLIHVISGYGFPNFEGDANDWWRVEIVDEPKDRLETLRTRFRLVHMLQSCALFSHEVQLPDWGFGQQEVTCMQHSKKPKTMWMIEETRNDLCKYYHR